MTHSDTALITGGNGNLGKRVAAKLIARGTRVIKFDIPGSAPERSEEREIVVSGDIRDTDFLKGLVNQYRPDAIYHLASLLSGSSEFDLQEAWSINADASFKLLHLASAAGVEKFFFASTAATYGPVEAATMPNDYPQWPESFYGATKVAVERLGVYFKQKHGMDFRCLRFPLVISPFAPQTAVSGFASHAVRAALNGASYRFPVAEETGVSTMFLDDVIDGIVHYVSADRRALTQHVYNLHAFYMTAGMAARAINARFPGFEYSFHPDDTVNHLIKSWPDVADDSDARRDWGWRPQFDLELSIDRMAEWLKLDA